MSALSGNPDPSLRSDDYEYNSPASSGQKRKRDSPPHTISSIEAAKTLTYFTPNVATCWHCQAPNTLQAQVITRAEPAVRTRLLNLGK